MTRKEPVDVLGEKENEKPVDFVGVTFGSTVTPMARIDGVSGPYQLFDPLTVEEYAALKADIAERGIMVPVEVDECGRILDGHHRVKAWHELRSEGINLPEYPRLVRVGMTEDAKRSHARVLNLMRRHLSKSQMAPHFVALRQDGMTLSDIADAVGVSHMTVHRTLTDVKVPLPVTTFGKDGKKRPTQYKPRQAPPASLLATNAATEEKIIAASPKMNLANAPSTVMATLPSKVHVGQNSGNNEWYTPAEYIDAARAVMGHIDLDPASTEAANEVIQAQKFYTENDNGLLYDWHGRVWMNPPYAQPAIADFCAKMREEFDAGRVTEAIVLVNNATETAWFHSLVESASAVCFPLARIRFWAPGRETATPLQGQAIVYLGNNAERFLSEFRFGWTAKVIDEHIGHI